jgi:hypothetical protein
MEKRGKAEMSGAKDVQQPQPQSAVADAQQDSISKDEFFI